MKKTGMLAAMILFGACSDGTGPADDLLVNRGKWLAHAVPSYTVEVSRYCFCYVNWMQPVRLTVVDNVIVSAVAVSSGDTLSATDLAASGYRTVDDLFQVVLDALAGHAASVHVTYDPVLGYPREIAIDYIDEAVDDEQTFQAANVTILARDFRPPASP